MHEHPSAASRNGTDGRVYGGDEDLIHIKDGYRREFGRITAAYVDTAMREYASRRRYTDEQRETQALCPGCYMPALFNAAIELAKANGQPLDELGLTLANAFLKLAAGECVDGIEEILVIEGK